VYKTYRQFNDIFPQHTFPIFPLYLRFTSFSRSFPTSKRRKSIQLSSPNSFPMVLDSLPRRQEETLLRPSSSNLSPLLPYNAFSFTGSIQMAYLLHGATLLLSRTPLVISIDHTELPQGHSCAHSLLSLIFSHQTAALF